MAIEHDKRLSKRVSVLLKGTYRLNGSDFPFSIMTAVNINTHGICFVTDEALEADRLIELTIILPDNEPLALFAKTIWSSQINNSDLFRAGIQILNLDSEDFKKFKAFYEGRLAEPPKI